MRSPYRPFYRATRANYWSPRKGAKRHELKATAPGALGRYGELAMTRAPLLATLCRHRDTVSRSTSFAVGLAVVFTLLGAVVWLP